MVGEEYRGSHLGAGQGRAESIILSDDTGKATGTSSWWPFAMLLAARCMTIPPTYLSTAGIYSDYDCGKSGVTSLCTLFLCFCFFIIKQEVWYHSSLLAECRESCGEMGRG